MKNFLKQKMYDQLARHILCPAKFYDEIICIESNQKTNTFYERVNYWAKNPTSKKKLTEIEKKPYSDSDRRMFVWNGLFNTEDDIQSKLNILHGKMSRGDRLSVVIYNPYLKFLYRILDFFKLREGNAIETFPVEADLINFCHLCDLELVRLKEVPSSPLTWWKPLRFFFHLINLIPKLRHLTISWVAVFRVVGRNEGSRPSISIVIPARNEKGNIESAILQMPKSFKDISEIIFIEGNSTDETWQEVCRVKEKYSKEWNIKAFQQKGKGKNDAVRLGFSKATCDLLTILDADLTMPPKDLEKFYQAYVSGKGDFINGSRLFYPKEKHAMRFLNQLGNVFFAKSLSYVLQTRFTDSLCGTKLLSRQDYIKITKWRDDFGDFDPFGDFELIFPSSELLFRSVDIPICYRERTYGSTNISRFSHGLILLKMTLLGLFKLRLRVQ